MENDKVPGGSKVGTTFFLLLGAGSALLLASLWPSFNDSRPLGQMDGHSLYDDQALDLRIARLEASISALTSRVKQLQDLVADELEVSGDRASGPRQRTAGGNEAPEAGVQLQRPADSGEYVDETLRLLDRTVNPPSLAKRLVEAEFSANQAQQISNRLDELTVEAMQERLRKGALGTPYDAYLSQHRYVERRLQDEFGDLVYERYRLAAGLPTDVMISAVEPDSIGQYAGLSPGDLIISYNGQRVMELWALEELINENKSGAPALIEVVRKGQRVHLRVPHGDLGITELSPIERLPPLIGH